MFFRRRKKGKSTFPFYMEDENIISYVQSEKGSLFKSYFKKGYDFRMNYDEGAPVLLDKELVGDTFEEYEELLNSKEEKEK